MKRTEGAAAIIDDRSSHEEQLVRSFVEPSRQERFIEFLSSPKKRRKFTRELGHRKTRLFDIKYLKAIPPSQQNPDSLFSLLVQLGSPSRCYIISEGPLDGQHTELLEALEEVVGRGMGTVLSCVPGRLAYFESEDERYVLHR